MAHKKRKGRFKVTNKNVPNRTLKELSRMGLVNFVACLLLKILYNLVYMQITANIIKILRIAQRDFTLIFDVLSESRIGFVSFLVFLAVGNVFSFTTTRFY